jgi:dipeptide/tripeptide permease
VEQPAGALNGGMQFANAFSLLFKFLAYTLPVFGAWIGDVKIGRYSAIMVGVLICGVSHIIQIFGALPSVLQRGQGVAPFLVSLFLLAIGAGIFKPNILPTILDQYNEQQPYVQTTKSGERVIVDPKLTINRISLLFYSFVNVGAMVGIPTSYAEKLVGFWLAFLLPGIIYFSLPLLLIFTKKHTKITKPQGSQLEVSFKIIRFALTKSRGAFWRKNFWDSAKPSMMAETDAAAITWTDETVEDVRRTLQACQLFLWFPIWYLNDGGIGVVATSQASSLTKLGVPNDLLGNINPITVILFSPLLTYAIYPVLERFKIMPGRIKRITIGFTLAWISSVYGALVQWHVYRTSPCGNFATKCKIGARVSPLSVWAQLPIYILGAMSECLAQVTAYEIAYARAPKNMKAIVMSVFLFMNALSSAIALIATPGIKDPHLIWAWASPGITLLFITVVFYWRHRAMDREDEAEKHSSS